MALKRSKRKNRCNREERKCSIDTCPCHECKIWMINGSCPKSCENKKKVKCKFEEGLHMELNLSPQSYKQYTFTLMARPDYGIKKAKRFRINNSYQNVWIPNKHLEADGTIKQGENIDYIVNSYEFRHKLTLIGDKNEFYTYGFYKR